MDQSALAFEIRIHALESLILGLNSAYDGRTDSETNSTYRTRRPIARRIGEIEESLNRASEGSDAINRLIAGYDRYKPLLTDQADSKDDNKEDGSEGRRVTANILSEPDLLPDSTKVTMILEAAPDIRGAERDLRQIELLKKRQVEGAGRLEEILPFRGALSTAQSKADTGRAELRAVRVAVQDLLQRYNDITNTASDLFIDIHHRLENMEEAVSRAERKKRKDQAERY